MTRMTTNTLKWVEKRISPFQTGFKPVESIKTYALDQ